MGLLTAEDVWRVMRLQKEDGCRLLTKLLKWEDFDEERDLKPGILLDYLYNTIIFTAEKGFPWPSVAMAVSFSQELLCETKGKTIQEAIGKLWDKCEEYQNKLNSDYLQHLANYLLGTFFQHYRLYQFVLCKVRAVDQIIHALEVHAPQPFPPLKSGTDVELWRYQQQLGKLSEAKAQLRNGMSAFREARMLKREQEMDMFYKDLKFQNKQVVERAPKPLLLKTVWCRIVPELLSHPPRSSVASLIDSTVSPLKQQSLEKHLGEAYRRLAQNKSRKSLEKIVKAVHNIQMTAASEILQKEIETTFQILDLKLQKTTMPFLESKTLQSSLMMRTKARKLSKNK